LSQRDEPSVPYSPKENKEAFLEARVKRHSSLMGTVLSEGMHKNKKIKLKVVVAPSVGRALPAPPVIMASTHTVDYECGHCGVLLMHAELDQVHNLLIHCTKCGAYNSTDV
jgi:hypothetical protein